MGEENGDSTICYLYMDGIVFTCKDEKEKVALKRRLEMEKKRMIVKYSQEFMK